jgi:hypothetical protein
MQGIRLTWPANTTESYSQIHTRDTTIDLTQYEDGTAADTENDYIGFVFYLSDADMVDTGGFELTFTDSLGGMFQIDILPTSFVDGWNIVLLSKDDFTDYGGDWSIIKSATLIIDIDSGYQYQYMTMGIMALVREQASDVPQPLDTTDSPTFAGLTLTGLTADKVLTTNGSKALTSSSVTTTELDYLTGQDQSFATTSQVQFRDLTLTSTVSNDICTLAMNAYTAGSTANNNRCAMTFVNKATVGNDLLNCSIYNDGTFVAAFGCDTVGYYKSPEYFWDVNSNEAFRITNNRVLLNNGATKETSMLGGLTLKQGTNPSTSTADQISLFATSGSDCTLGLHTERSVVSSTPVADSHLTININGTLYNVMLETV